MQKILAFFVSVFRPSQKAGPFYQRFNSHWPNRDQSQWNGGRFLNAMNADGQDQPGLVAMPAEERGLYEQPEPQGR